MLSKIIEQVLLEIILRYVGNEEVIFESSRDFTKSKLCLKNLVAFYVRVTVLVDK